jgi:hypothetical protein
MTVDRELNEMAEKMQQLPANWWQNAAVASSLLKEIRACVVPLLVAGYVGREVQYSVYSGFFVTRAGTAVWLSAGHVVDEVTQLLSSPNFKILTMAWLDDFEAKGAEGVPLHRANIPTKSWKSEGLDIGAILPSALDVGNIFKNDKVKMIDAGAWENLSAVHPEGFYAIGFPRPWSIHSQRPFSSTKLLHSVKADLACLPLEEVLPPPEFAGDPVWSNPRAFYGKILPFPDYPDFDLDNLRGMSGGPILSVERTENGYIGYRLVGVIQSWARAQSIIRAEPIDLVSRTVDKWLDERDNTTSSSE